MKRTGFVLAAFFICVAAFAQQKTREEYQQRYNLLANRLGEAGVGIETIINNWEKDYPDDVNMLVAKFNYYFTKSQKVEIVVKDQKKFLGADPVLNLTDSLGTPVNYFQEIFYDDEMFGLASQAIDKAIRVEENDVELKFAKITALLAYEKESPDMAVSSLKGIIDYYYSGHPSSYPNWKYQGEPIDNQFFTEAIQEYCYSFFLIASPNSYECFKEISEKMLKYNPSNTDFLANVGTYYQTVRNDSKTAIKYYTKVLKLNPDNYVASKNLVIIAKKNRDVKAEKKYLPALIRNARTDIERQSAEVRLKALNSK